jgi:PadR family transcriptional regulator PadR
MTEPELDSVTLDVLNLLLSAWETKAEVHGWYIMNALKRSGPSVYRALDRLEEYGWINASWEVLPPGDERPRRRYYSLVADKAEAARSRTGLAQTNHRRSFRPLFGFGAGPRPVGNLR